MSSLSREIAKWIQMNPGPIYGMSDDQVWAQAISRFIQDRRWRAPCPANDFMIHIANLGYKTETRTDHSKDPTGNSHFIILALPEPHRGF